MIFDASEKLQKLTIIILPWIAKDPLRCGQPEPSRHGMREAACAQN
jgi:hypothetical protein